PLKPPPRQDLTRSARPQPQPPYRSRQGEDRPEGHPRLPGGTALPEAAGRLRGSRARRRLPGARGRSADAAPVAGGDAEEGAARCRPPPRGGEKRGEGG